MTDSVSTASELQGRYPSLRTLAMPADTNPNGDIFGGWILAQMDLAGGTYAFHVAGGRVATVAITGMSFLKPVNVGDEVSVYCSTHHIGTTSIAVSVETWVCRRSASYRRVQHLAERQGASLNDTGVSQQSINATRSDGLPEMHADTVTEVHAVHEKPLEEKVTEGLFTFVAIDDFGKPRPVIHASAPSQS